MSKVGGGAFAPGTPRQFVEKWKSVDLTERATAQSHFNDLCWLLGHEDPIAADPRGEWFAFEKGVTKTGGGEGFADVWKRNHFAWEYKRKKRDLDEALLQLTRYAAALEHPPLRVACDTNRIVIETAWTNAVPQRHEITLTDLTNPAKLDILHSVFFDPEKLRPKETRTALTREAADKFSTIAMRLQGRGTSEDIAHFVNQLVFCFFANSVKLLPDGFFPKLLKRIGQRPAKAKDYFNQLFAAMETGGEFDLNDIAWFNGGLFDGRRALPLDEGDIGLLQAAASLDWSQIDPTIFGALFERFLDPEKRKQIGAHYTDSEKIMMIVEPVILRPLRDEWSATKTEIETLLSGSAKPPMRAKERRRMSPQEAAEEIRSRFLERLQGLSILDPACGSGNFLYLALQGVKDIENKANLEAEALGLSPRALTVGPEILHGIEINEIAAELARTTIWIGDIQWRRRNGIYYEPPPILRKLDAIQRRDALVDVGPDGGIAEAVWPLAEFIVGNPPFLGDRKMIGGLGEEYVEGIRSLYNGRVLGRSDLVCYWFAKALDALKLGKARRVGFVATNSISGGNNLFVLQRITDDVRIFEAWSDEEWTIDGAAVRVALICYATGQQEAPRLDGKIVAKINADLSAGIRVYQATGLRENKGISFVGTQKNGPFDVSGDTARIWLQLPINPNGRPNSDVVKPWANGQDITGRPSDRWIIDFGARTTEREASLFEHPFAHVLEHVRPTRLSLRRKWHRTYWWLHGDPRPALRRAIGNLTRFIITPRVSKHRVFAWVPIELLPDSATVAIARDDDTTFGILHSRFHEAWSLRLGTRLGVGNDPRYTPTTTFETFPFPDGLTPNIFARSYARDSRAIAIAEAAKRLDHLRTAWLNPPGLVRIEPEVAPGYPDRILPKDTVAAAKLRERTLTNLYNRRPQWLDDAHRDLDAAVAAAYGWAADIAEEDALARLLELNLVRATSTDSLTVKPKVRKKRPTLTAEEARRSPQFKLPIAGGKQTQAKLPLVERLIDERPVTTSRRSRRRRA